MTILRILGSAAGGGFPQWNCHCRNCVDVHIGEPDGLAYFRSRIPLAQPDIRLFVCHAVARGWLG